MAGGSLGKLFVEIGMDTRGLKKGATDAEKEMYYLQKGVVKASKTIGVAMTGIGVASILIAKKFTNSFIAIDSAMAGVRKTTGMAADEIATMKRSFIGLSKVMPTAADDLANIGAIAGQLGIQGQENILGFTEDIAKMAVAFDMSAEDSATAMAKMAKIYDIQIEKVDALGSAINVLGNTTAAKESQIMAYSMSLGAAADVMGFSATEALALGATLISMGQDASMAGTRINSALTSLGKNTALAANTLGMSETAFKKAFGDDPMRMLQALATEIGTIKDPLDQNTAAVELFGTYGGKAMIALAADMEGLDTNLAAAQKGFEENTSLTEEYANATDTLAAKLQIAENRQEAAAISLGGAMAPATIAVAGATALLADGVAALPGPLQTAAGMALTLGQSFVVLGPLLMGVSAAMNVMKVTTFGAIIPALVAHAVAAWAAIAPYLVIIAPILAVVAVLAILEAKFGVVTKAISILSDVFSPLISGIKGFLGIASDAADAAEEVAWGVEEEARMMEDATGAADALSEAQKRVADSAGEVDMLTSAYEELQGAIADALGLTEDIDDQARAVEHAEFGLADAEKKYAEAIKEHGAGSDEAARADLRRRDAVDRLDDAQKKQIKLTEELATADTKKEGILSANNAKSLEGMESMLHNKQAQHEHYQEQEILAQQAHTAILGDLADHRADMEIAAAEKEAAAAETAANKSSGVWAGALRVILGPVGLVITVLKKLESEFGIVTKSTDAVKKAFAIVSDWLSDAIPKAIDTTVGFITGLGDKLLFILGPIGAVVYAFKHWDEIVGIISGVFRKVFDFMMNLDREFKKAGWNLMVALANGITSGISSAIGAVSGAVEEIMSYLPSSDAKKGPLSNLTASGIALMTTFEKGMNRIDLSGTMEHVLPTPVTSFEKGIATSSAAPATAAAPAATTFAARAPPVPAANSDNRSYSSSVNIGDVSLSSDYNFETLMKEINRHQALQRTQRGAV